MSYLLTGLSRLTSSTLRSRQALLQREIKVMSTQIVRFIVLEEPLCSVKGSSHSPGIQVDQQVPAHLFHQQVPTNKAKSLGLVRV